jgi:hypothetical protein
MRTADRLPVGIGERVRRAYTAGLRDRKGAGFRMPGA